MRRAEDKANPARPPGIFKLKTIFHVDSHPLETTFSCSGNAIKLTYNNYIFSKFLREKKRVPKAERSILQSYRSGVGLSEIY